MNLEQCRLAKCGESIQFLSVFFCKSNRKHIKYIVTVIFAGSMNVINAGLEYGWTSVAFPILMNKNDNKTQAVVTSDQGVWIATLPLPGAVVGALMNAFVCDIVGRKPLIIFSTLPYTIHWILIGVANSAPTFYIARVLTGFSSGIALSAIPMYTGEISSPRFRGRLCAIAPMCIVGGVFLINLLGLFLTIKVSALVLLTFPLTSLFGLLFMPESPHFYVMKKKDDKALVSLRIFQGRRDVDTDFQRIKQAVEEQTENKKEGLKALFTIRVYRRCFAIVMFLRAAQPLCGISVLIYYSSVILGDDASHLSVKYATMAFAVALMTSVFIGLLIVDRLGRRPLALFSLFGSFLGLMILAIYMHLKDSGTDVSSYTFLPLVALIIIVSFYGIGLQQIPYVVQSELFSTGVKAPAVASGLIVFCIFSLLTSKYFQYMHDQAKAHIPVYTFASFAVITFIFVLFLMPETKNLTLEDVQEMMKQGKLHFKNVVIDQRVVE